MLNKINTIASTIFYLNAQKQLKLSKENDVDILIAIISYIMSGIFLITTLRNFYQLC